MEQTFIPHTALQSPSTSKITFSDPDIHTHDDKIYSLILPSPDGYLVRGTTAVFTYYMDAWHEAAAIVMERFLDRQAEESWGVAR